MRRAGVAGLLVVATTILGSPVAADTSATAHGGGSDDPTVRVSVTETGDGTGPPRGSGAISCRYYDAEASLGANADVQPEVGGTYQLICWDEAGDVVYSDFVVYEPAARGVDPATLARMAWRELPLAFPTPHTSPARDQRHYVGLATWLGVDPEDWQPRSATASVAGLSATVTATPTRIEWAMGDGVTVVCRGPSHPYDTARPPSDQHTDCAHTYNDASTHQLEGTFRVRATMHWTVRWEATNGRRGSLPDAFRSTEFGLRVAEAQALRTEVRR